ncbi:hypothetical protein PI126_g17786 [Phytophthora idaei]|nr:hypothetical protein PI126_g17786 [Phytophthora idaei]
MAQMFPTTRRLPCSFHAITWLERQAGRLSTGTAERNDKLKASLSTLVTATSKTEWEKGKAYLLQLLDGNEDHERFRTFIDNWDGMRAEWVLYERGNVPHLGKPTNNRLESKWGEIKLVISRDNTIDELISTLIFLQEVAEDDFLREYRRVGSCPQRESNQELAALAMNLSPFAFDIMEEEFNYATSGHADYEVQAESEVAVLESRRTGAKHTITTKLYSCDCIYWQTYLLPRRHIMFWCLQNWSGTVIPPYNSIAQRWMRGCMINDNATTPTFKATVAFLGEFAKALQEGRFAEFAGVLPCEDMAVIKKEQKTTAGTSATTVSTADPKTGKSNKKLTRSHGDKTDDKSAEYTGTKIRASRTAAKQLLNKDNPTTFEDLLKLLANGYSSASSVRSTMKERKLKTCEALRPVQIRLMQPGAPAPDVTSLLDMRRIQEAKASFP